MSAPPKSLHELRGRLKVCLSAASREESHSMYAGLVSLSRWPGWTLDRLREHQRYLVAWLDELSREGDLERADQLVAQIAAAERVLREPSPGGLTLEGVVRRRASQGGDANEVATDVLLACPTRMKRHWDLVLALAQRVAST